MKPFFRSLLAGSARSRTGRGTRQPTPTTSSTGSGGRLHRPRRVARGTVTYRYDLNGNLQTRNDSGNPSGAVNFASDPLNRELSETPKPPEQRDLRVLPGRGVESILDGQLTSTYTHTRVHMAQTLTDSDLQDQGVGPIRFFYDDPRDTRRTRTVYPNGVTMAADYDSSGRIDDIRADRGPPPWSPSPTATRTPPARTRLFARA
jgi:hypothetical protein